MKRTSVAISTPRIDASEAIEQLQSSDKVSSCFVTAINDEYGVPIPVLITEPINRRIVSLVQMIDGNGQVCGSTTTKIVEALNGKRKLRSIRSKTIRR